MLLLEFFNFNDETNSFTNDRRYDPQLDLSVIKQGDTRKIRLTLRQLNQIRLQAEAHDAESKSELGFIKQMYGNPPEPEEI